MKCWQCLLSRKYRKQSCSGSDYFSPATIQTSLWLISLINCIPSISARKQFRASAIFGNYHIAIPVLQLGNWGADQGWICDKANHQKGLCKGSELLWVVRARSLQHRQIGQCHPGGKASNGSEIFWPFGLCHNSLCLQIQRNRGINVNWWHKSTTVKRTAGWLKQASGRVLLVKWKAGSCPK